MNKKIEIVIDDDNHYVSSVKDGARFTSVDYNAPSYGGGSPCDTPEQIKSAIEHAKRTITEAGDRPIVRDVRDKATLRAWF